MNWRTFWHSVWPYTTTVWGTLVGIVTVLLALYYGPRQMLETLDWYRERFFDSKVRRFLTSQMGNPLVSAHGRRMLYGTAVNLSDIVRATKLSERSIKASLKRLEENREAIGLENDRWKAADRIE